MKHEAKERDYVEVAHYMPTVTDIGWEGEYDASIEDTVYHLFPCPEFFHYYRLHQMKQGGFYAED